MLLERFGCHIGIGFGHEALKLLFLAFYPRAQALQASLTILHSCQFHEMLHLACTISS